ncbi:hypothetical protein DL93DRAFT_2094607 [Clavulina sp. PMI_390]|nr:hypothetical protein DL93DRAFT_2094607 [Clavulina sp. PMI_390]
MNRAENPTDLHSSIYVGLARKRRRRDHSGRELHLIMMKGGKLIEQGRAIRKWDDQERELSRRRPGSSRAKVETNLALHCHSYVRRSLDPLVTPVDRDTATYIGPCEQFQVIMNFSLLLSNARLESIDKGCQPMPRTTGRITIQALRANSWRMIATGTYGGLYNDKNHQISALTRPRSITQRSVLFHWGKITWSLVEETKQVTASITVQPKTIATHSHCTDATPDSDAGVSLMVNLQTGNLQIFGRVLASSLFSNCFAFGVENAASWTGLDDKYTHRWDL